MKSIVRVIVLLLPVALECVFLIASANAHEHSDQKPADAHLGTVNFGISCEPKLQGDFNHAVALLHSFWHSEAQRAFETIAASSPKCAMAYWGVAMSHFHLGLSWPNATDLAAGLAAVEQAREASDKTARESAYIAALGALYDEFSSNDSWKYFQKYADALGQIAADYPSDVEARIFRALALILAQPPDDVDLAKMKQAVLILTPLLTEYPDHPGVAHYLIHASDAPGMAQGGSKRRDVTRFQKRKPMPGASIPYYRA